MRKTVFFLLRTFSIALAIVIVGCYFFFCPRFLMDNYSHVLFCPFPADKELYSVGEIGGVKKEDVYFKNAQGIILHGWFFQKPGAQKTVLFAHGNGGNISYRQHLITAILDAGASVFIYDYSGYGLSQGKPTVPQALSDSEAAYNYLTDVKKIPLKDIVLYGESLGGGMVAHLLQTKDAGGIILDSTFTSVLGLAKKKVPPIMLYPPFLGPNPALNVQTVLTGRHPPLLIIHGKMDSMLPASEAEENFAAASEPKSLVILPASDHNDKDPDLNQYRQSLKDYFANLPD